MNISRNLILNNDKIMNLSFLFLQPNKMYLFEMNKKWATHNNHIYKNNNFITLVAHIDKILICRYQLK